MALFSKIKNKRIRGGLINPPGDLVEKRSYFTLPCTLYYPPDYIFDENNFLPSFFIENSLTQKLKGESSATD